MKEILYHRCPKSAVHGILIDRFLAGRTKINVAEFGRLRGTDNWHRDADGWSTKAYAEDPRVAQVWSVDEDEQTIKHCIAMISDVGMKKIRFLPALEDLRGVPPLDLIYIDGPASPDKAACGGVTDKTLVCCDDFSLGEKYIRLLEHLNHNVTLIVVGDTIVFLRDDWNADLSWVGKP